MPTKKKILIAALSLFTLVWMSQISGFTDIVPSAYAAEGSEPILNEIQNKFSIFGTLFQTVGFIAFAIVNKVADPSFYLSTTNDIDGQLHEIWIISRDTVNIIFAFMLVIGALATVITAKGEFFQRYAFKFVLAVILVNFSWFFPRVILDVGNVMAATIYQLPSTLATAGLHDCKTDTGTLCEYADDFHFFNKEVYKIVIAAGTSSVSNPGLGLNGTYKCPSVSVCYRTQPLATATNTADGILSGLIMNHAKFGTLLQVVNLEGAAAGPVTDPLELVTKMINYIMHTGFTIALIIAISLVMISMAIIFLIRLPILWITIGFMPFMFIGFVIGDLTSSFNTMAIFKKFVTAAFLPAIVAIPLTVGYIILNATIAIANIPGEATSFFPGGSTTIIGLIWRITTILVIWKGFFFAVNAAGAEYSSSVAGIKSFGGKIGNIAIKAPLSIPVLPGPKGGRGTSILEAAGGARGISNLADRGQLLEPGKLKELLGGNKGTGSSTVNAKSVTEVVNKLNISNAVATTALNSNNVDKIKALIKGDLLNKTEDFKIAALTKIAKDNNIVVDPKLEELIKKASLN